MKLSKKVGQRALIFLGPDVPQVDLIGDPNNPSISTKMSIIGMHRTVGVYRTQVNETTGTGSGQTTKLIYKNIPNKHKSFFYYDQWKQGNKTELIRERINSSKWQIILLTLIFIMMVTGFVMCISYK